MHVQVRVSKCVLYDGISIFGSNFAAKFFSIIWSHTDFEMLAIVVRP